METYSINAEVLQLLNYMLADLQYGEIKLVVQNNKILDVIKTERVRIGK